MPEPPRPPDASAELLAGYFNGALDADQLVALERWLAADPAHADRFARYAIEQRALEGALKRERVGDLSGLSVSALELVFDAEAPGPDASPTLADLARLEAQAGAVEPIDLTDELARRQMAAREQSRHARRAAERARGGAGHAGMTLPKPVFWLGVAALIGLAASLAYYFEGSSTPAPPLTAGGPTQGPGTAAPRTPDVAGAVQVRSTVDTRWTGTGGLSTPTTLYTDRQVSLARGMAELAFENGVTVIVQAPATFEPTGPGALRLVSGRITARVPDTASTFTVTTPRGLTIDRGRDFGVEVSDNGQTLAQAFTGGLLLRGPGGHTVELATNEAARADLRGAIRRVAADPLAFVNEAEYTAHHRAGESAYARWLAYSYTLRRDPATLIYFTFDGLEADRGVLRNDAPHQGAPPADATYEVSGQAPGRFAEKPTVRFGRDSDHVAAALNREMEAVTLAGWYWVDQMNGTFVPLLHTDSFGTTPGGIHWHLNANHGDGWAVEFVLQRRLTPQPSYWYDALAPGLSPRAMTGRWVHFALCYDSASGHARLYVDGQEAVRTRLDDGVPVRLRSFRLGHWHAAPDRREAGWPRPLRGRIDEFLVLARAMSAREVADLYEAGRPDN